MTTADGRPYYQNSITRETSWAQPEGWLEPGRGVSDAETAADAHTEVLMTGGAVGVQGAGTPGGGVMPGGNAGGGATREADGEWALIFFDGD